jgi:nicotinamidase-related amidase
MNGGLNSSKLALIVIDMQNEFAPMAQPILTELNATIASARRAGISVIFTQHGHPNPETDEKTSVLVRWWGASGSIRKGSQNWKLLSNLDVASNEIILDEKTKTGPPCQSTLDIISYSFAKIITCAEMRAKFDTIHKDKSK